jgi:hypothetical protein
VTDESSLWSAADCSRWFLIQGSVAPPVGSTPIKSLSGESAVVDPDWLGPFEVTEDQARCWAKDQLGQTLEELKIGIDERFTNFPDGVADLRKNLEKQSTAKMHAPGERLLTSGNSSSAKAGLVNLAFLRASRAVEERF